MICMDSCNSWIAIILSKINICTEYQKLVSLLFVKKILLTFAARKTMARDSHSKKDSANKDYIVNPVIIRLDSSDRGSIYEAITAMGLRARQINDDVKQQLQARMQHIDPLEDETEYGNYDQMQISKEFDKIPKPTFIAMREIFERKLFYRVEEQMPLPPQDYPPQM